MALRVHLADDHTMFREGLKALLASREGVEVVGSSPTGDEALAVLQESQPDVVVTQLDMDLRTTEGILSGIREASPNSRIVVLTMLDNLHYLKALSRMGIDAYVHKSSSEKELVATIRALARETGGDNVVISMPRGALERMNEGLMGTLSERETEVVVLAARGLSNLQIAQHLRLAEATVKRHLANVFQKMGVGSRSEAVRVALMEQWIGLTEITQEAPSADGPARDGSADGAIPGG